MAGSALSYLVLHVKSDSDRARVIERALMLRGIGVTRHCVLRGDAELNREVSASIAAGSVVILILSRGSVQSRIIGQVAAESAARRTLAPVLFDGVMLGTGQSHIQGLDLTYWPLTVFDSEMERLADSLVTFPKPEPRLESESWRAKLSPMAHANTTTSSKRPEIARRFSLLAAIICTPVLFYALSLLILELVQTDEEIEGFFIFGMTFLIGGPISMTAVSLLLRRGVRSAAIWGVTGMLFSLLGLLLSMVALAFGAGAIFFAMWGLVYFLPPLIAFSRRRAMLERDARSHVRNTQKVSLHTKSDDPLPANKKARIFLSYQRRERNAVAALAAALKKHGYDVWWDSSLDAGRPFASEILRNLIGSDVVVTCWSRRARSSPWVLCESEYALRRGRLTIVRLDDSDLPPRWNGLASTNFRSWKLTSFGSEIESLIADISTLSREAANAVEVHDLFHRDTLEPVPPPDVIRNPLKEDAARTAWPTARSGLLVAAAVGSVLPASALVVLGQFDSFHGVINSLSPLAAAYLLVLPWFAAFLLALVPASGLRRAAVWAAAPAAVSTLVLSEHVRSLEFGGGLTQMAFAAAVSALFCMLIAFCGRRVALGLSAEARSKPADRQRLIHPNAVAAFARGGKSEQKTAALKSMNR